MTLQALISLPLAAENAMNNAKGEAASNSPRPLIETQALTQGYRPLTITYNSPCRLASPVAIQPIEVTL